MRWQEKAKMAEEARPLYALFSLLCPLRLLMPSYPLCTPRDLRYWWN